MLEITYSSINFFRPLLVPICFCCAWALVVGIGFGIYRTVVAIYGSARRMHQIPCSRCQFFTNNYRLKCTINPIIANTEQAIYCGDYSRHNHNYFRKI